ncbi:MAG: cardiolipin synthase [Methanospirillum sp.]|nr:cardiolipin synthase [Methanospirillum sp.]
MNEGLLLWNLVLLGILLCDSVFIIVVVFVERKNPSATLAWVLALLFLPVIGFVLYLFLGQTYSREKMFRVKQEADRRLRVVISSQERELRHEDAFAGGSDRASAPLRRMVLMLLANNGAVLTLNNRVRVFTDGKEKFAGLLGDIRAATGFVHLEYFIWKDDGIGNEMRVALTERARAGVEVRLLCDGLGCAGLPPHFFDEFRSAGGRVAFFFPSFLRYLNLRYNYRNHRKIAVIDGTTGYIGGFNIGDDYLGLDPVWGYWRDAAVRIRGSAVLAAEIRFFLDWNYAAPGDRLEYDPRYFPEIAPGPGIPIQVVSGGPDTGFNPVKESYLKMIGIATESVYLQTPYFIPDESVLDALRIAALSGIDVRIMMPDRPDHPFVYWAGMSYIRQLLDSGVKAYTYDNGFIHAKTIVVDGAVASVGSANWDVRSFRLNFETNAVMYDPGMARELMDAFLRDLEVCSPITIERLDALPWGKRARQSIARLFSPML